MTRIGLAARKRGNKRGDANKHFCFTLLFDMYYLSVLVINDGPRQEMTTAVTALLVGKAAPGCCRPGLRA